MHPTVAISLLVCLGAVVLGSAAVARDAASRDNWVAGAALFLAGVWCFLDALINTAPDAGEALFWSRSLGFAYLFMAPLSLDLLCELRPEVRVRLGGWVRAAYWAGAGLAILHFATPWFMGGADATGWGWVYRPGPLFWVSFVFTAAIPVYAVSRLWRGHSAVVAATTPFPGLLGAAVLVPVILASLTDAILPLAGVPSPRVGAMSVALICGSTWLALVRSDREAVTASGFARQILDVLPDGIALLQADGRIRSANASLGRMLGQPVQALVGQPVEAYLAESWPECEAGVDARETWMRTRADELVPVSLSSTVLYDRQGYVVGRLLAVRDHREVVALRRRLVTSGRMAAVGELSAGIAHEVNNPVAYIHANLHLLERHAAELAKRGGEVAAAATEAGCCVGRCLEGIDAVAAIVRDVRGLSHADGDERRAVDLCALVGGVLRLAGQRLRHGRVDFACPMLPPVECAEQQVKQVFLDLVLNAARVTPEGGHIRIRGGRCDREVWVSVEDEGPPIPAAELTGLFDPLATNRAIREGRGLGLSVSYQILRQHGGRIEVDSPSECGTRVTLRWPIVGCGDEREGVDA